MEPEVQTSKRGRPRKAAEAAPLAPQAAPEAAPGFELQSPSEMVARDDGAGAAVRQGEPPARLSLILNQDGTINLDSMRPASRDKLKAAIQDESLAGRLGLAPTLAAEVQLEPKAVEPAYRLLGQLEAAIAVRVWGIPQEQAEEIFSFTPREMGEVCPPTARLAVKYGGAALARYKDEMALGLSLLAIGQQKFMAVSALAEAAAQEREAAALAAKERARAEAAARTEEPPVTIG